MKKFSILLTILVFGATSLFAQTKTVTGTVVDDLGLGLPQVTVMIKGTSKGVVSDLDGNYSIDVNEGEVLVFSYVMMQDKEVQVGASNVYNVSLSSDNALDEVVVVGYTAKKERDIQGSVAKVGADKLTEVASASFAEGLDGAASGVRISQSSGSPGGAVQVQIRGLNSINLSSDPLWIIDGVAVNTNAGGQDPMATINPNDIESIQILKDAKATAIYGSRGSAGVIIVTTKQGKAGTCETSLSYKGGVTMMPRDPNELGLANSEQYFQIMDMANANIGSSDAFDPNTITGLFNAPEGVDIEQLTPDEAKQINTNWFDEVLRIGQFHDFNYSTSCGFEKGNYYVSAGYKNIQGVINNNDFKSMTARVNLNYDLFENLKVGVKSTFGYTDNVTPYGGDYGTFSKALQEALPWYPITSDVNGSGYWNSWSGRNVAANNDLELYNRRLQNYRGLGNVYAQFNLPWSWAKGLYIRSEANFDFIQTNAVAFTSNYLNRFGTNVDDAAATNNVSSYNLFANWNRTFADKHNVEVTAGTETETSTRWTRSIEVLNPATSYQYVGDGLPGNVSDVEDIASYMSSENYLRSFFGRADYKLLDRYLLGASFRQDGSSKFYGDNIWGTFSAFSFGWIISDEGFMSGIRSRTKMNLLKLRGSTGQTGNNAIGGERFANIFTNKSNLNYGLTTDISAGTYMTNIGNQLITWETTNSYDGGLDFGFMKNRIEGSVAYYLQKIEDLLLYDPLPPSAIVSGYYDNIGDMQNSGFEFNISSANIVKKLQRFEWKTDFNFSTNTNEVLVLNESTDQIINGTKIIKVGQELNTWYMPEFAELNSETGYDMIYEIDKTVWENEGKTVRTGNLIPATLEYLSNNKMILEGKSTTPSYYGGLSNKFKIKNFDINIRLTYAGGHYMYDYLAHRTTQAGDGSWNLSADLLDNSWTPDNTDAEYPMVVKDYTYTVDGESVSFNNNSNFYSRYLHKADYIRLKAIELGYNFSQSLTDRIGIKRLRASASVTNVMTWGLFYNKWDPEVLARNNGNYLIPPLRTFNFGLNIGF